MNIKTSDEARKRIAEAGITKDNVTDEQLQILRNCICARMRDSSNYNGTYRMDEKVSLFMTCSTEQWEGREAVSFNRDDFIGFAGWSNTNNLQPILQGVEDWLSALSGYGKMDVCQDDGCQNFDDKEQNKCRTYKQVSECLTPDYLTCDLEPVEESPDTMAGSAMEEKTMNDYLNEDQKETAGSDKVESSVMDEAFKSCKPPFFFRVGYIFDDAGNMIADEAGAGAFARMRGWGRLGSMKNAEELQDAIGKHIAQAMTEYWGKERP